MKPVLYESTETAFTSNGLGRLSDAMSCNVVEERNGSYELTMQYPVTGIHFSDITHSRIIYAIPADGKGPQPFRIYYISKPLNETVEIKAEHISYQLSHIPVQPFTAGNCAEAMAGLKSNSAESNPFTFWTDKTTVAPFSVKTPSSIRSLLGGTNGSILDAFGGGEYEFDQYTVKLHNSRGLDNNVQLKYGKNITDIKQEENIGSTYTGVYPYWLGTVDNVETLITLPEKVLHSANAQNFPYQRTIPLDLSSEFESQPTEAQLRTKAQAYMAANNIGVPNINIEVNFIALWQTEEYKQFANLERVNLCDAVTVEFPLLGISAKAKVVKTDYDVLKERYNSIEVGDARTKLATQITQATSDAVNALAQQVPTKSFLQQAVDHATQLITGGLGGNVVFTLNADGEPQEILIMDTDDVQTAVNVIRINASGIGFSTDGYDGPFATAWTIDGHFVADFIDTGTLSANRVRGGTLESTNGYLVLDLATGMLSTAGSANQTKLSSGKILFYKDNKEAGGISLGGWSGTADATGTKRNGTTVYVADDGGYVAFGRKTSTSNLISFLFNNGLNPDGLTQDIIGYGSMYLSGAVTATNFSATNFSATNTSGTAFAKIKSGGFYTGYSGTDYLRIYSSSTNTTASATIAAENLSTTAVLLVSSNTAIWFNAGGVQQLAINGSAVTCHHDFWVLGEKNRVVETKDYSTRRFSAYETSQPMFADIGEGIIGEDGKTYVFIDPMFLQSVDINGYNVFLQKYGQGDAYVSERTANYFVVEGTPSLKFAWEIKAKQALANTARYSEFVKDSNVVVSQDYAEKAISHLQELYDGRVSA